MKRLKELFKKQEPRPEIKPASAALLQNLGQFFPDILIQDAVIVNRENHSHVGGNRPYILEWDFSLRSQVLIDSIERKLIGGAIALQSHSDSKSALYKALHPAIFQNGESAGRLSPQLKKQLQIFINHTKELDDLLLTLGKLSWLEKSHSIECQVASWHSKPNLPSYNFKIQWIELPVNYCEFYKSMWGELNKTLTNSDLTLYIESGIQITPKFVLNLSQNLLPAFKAYVPSTCRKKGIQISVAEEMLLASPFQPSIVPALLFNHKCEALDPECLELAPWEYLIRRKPNINNDLLSLVFNHESIYRNPVFYFQQKLASQGLADEEQGSHHDNGISVMHTNYVYIIEKHSEFFKENLVHYLPQINSEYIQIKTQSLLWQRKIRL